MTFAVNKKYSKSTIKTPIKSAKICLKITETSKQYARHCCGIPVVTFGQVPHLMQCF